ncbi:MAG: TetR/AcrR family transcriptional regulator [Gordonia sp. (in: high G+C Gram-positive bacteria)]|uniref:TetR/AcrR family transcriptional regulator n=1 Tax=Gordonia sp. (in: high G+C Gram-positive bacteria) TaxID=84139 RepID=UPI0039E3AFC6
MAARLSRVEQRAHTRARLLATAREEFLRHGYAATGLDTIAERAGYSKGAVYSNFTDKTALCQAVLADIRDEKSAEVVSLVRSADGLEAVADALGDWLRASLGDMEWTSLELEFAARARTDPRVREMTAESRRRFRDTIAELLTEVVGDPAELAPGPAPDVSDVADLLLGTGIGLSVSRAFDPEVSLEPGIAAMKTVLGLFEALRRFGDPPRQDVEDVGDAGGDAPGR